jgi:competence protein ComEC
MTRRNIITVLVVLLAVGVLGGAFLWSQRPSVLVRWAMVNVSGADFSGDANLLDFQDGRIYLIDTGFDHFARHRLIPYLQEKGIRHINRLIITHAHKNHYGGVLSLLDAGITVDEVLFNLPEKSACDAEQPWGCDYKDAVAMVEAVRKKGIPVKPVHDGEVLYHDAARHVDLKVLWVFDGVHTPVGQTSINDTSIVMRLDAGPDSVMLAADLDRKLGEYEAEHGKDLKATILKVPHHGVESAAPDAFFDRVGAKYALVPGPKKLWLGERGRRIREYFAQRHIPTYVNGLNGNVYVTFFDTGLRIRTDD